jgi:hypothetical protein
MRKDKNRSILDVAESKDVLKASGINSNLGYICILEINMKKWGRFFGRYLQME